jgi:DNA gyrase/topoisomerase IV subunit B
MSPATLKETTLDPTRRHLLRVEIIDAEATEASIQTLMGRDVAPRFRFISERATTIVDLDV